MRRRTKIAAVLTAAALLSAVAVQSADAQPVRSSPKAYTRYLAVAGSATHLLYGTARTTKYINSISNDGPQYVLDAKHHRRLVPTGWTASLLSDRPLFRKTVYADGVHSERWKLPESHRSGTVALPSNAFVVSSAPNGWVTSVTIGSDPDTFGPIQQLTRMSVSGASTDLGVPYHDGAPFDLAASDAGLLAYSFPGDGGDLRPDGTIKYMAWSKPGTWRTLLPAAGVGDANVYDIQCTSSSALASCAIEETTKLLLLPLSPSKQPAVLTGSKNPCLQNGAALTSSAVWIVGHPADHCPAGKLERFTLAGTVQTSTRTYSRFQQPVVAFGRIVVGSKTQRTLFTLKLKDIRSTPKHLIGG